MSPLTIFTARRIHTMNPSLPQATAVAVRGGQIIEAGSLKTLAPWMNAYPHRIDDRFQDCVMMPGFIDPHLHPSLAAILLPTHFITAMKWELPHRTAEPVHGHNAFLEQLNDIHQGLADPDEPLISWGYHQIWHGRVDRQTLNAVSERRPIIIWQRSFHEVCANDAAIKWMGLQEDDLVRHPQIEASTGRFYETGLTVAMKGMRPHLLAPAWFHRGLELTRQAIHKGGHTTIADMTAGLFDTDEEWQSLCDCLDRPDTPFRVQMVPRAIGRGAGQEAVDGALAHIRGLKSRSTEKLFFRDHVKLFTDGGFFAELMQVQDPGFIDGHHGEWLMEPELFEALARGFWHAGYQIHVHCTGDLGLELALDVLEKLQWERPRVNHRFTIEHFGLSTPEQARRIADLGALVSANIYYVHELGHAYWQHSLGFERASQMARLGSLARHNVTTALHSDFTMAPAQPLMSAWVAVNRLGEHGQVLCPEERLSLMQALRAITIDAAYILGMEHEIGSIRAGKKADFTILEADPFEEPVSDLKDIPIRATVFEGQPYLLKAR